jgi:kynurenine formamidase
MNKEIIDLSHTISHGVITYKGMPGPIISDFWSRESSARNYDENTSFHIAKIDMVANTGTYIDTPFHRYSDGKDLSEVSLDRFCDLAGICFSSPYERNLESSYDLFNNTDLENKAVLIHTGWSEKWGKEEYQWNHPFLNREAAEYLVSRRPKLVGIDSCNIDDTAGRIRPVHSLLLKEGILIIEHLCNLRILEGQNFRFFAIPPKIRGVGSFPVRAFAIIDNK